MSKSIVSLHHTNQNTYIMERTQHQKEVRQFYGVLILIAVAIGAVFIGIEIDKWYSNKTKYDISQEVSILEKDKQFELFYSWYKSHIEDDTDTNPYNMNKVVYVLKTNTRDNGTEDYGDEKKIDSLKCIRYNEFVDYVKEDRKQDSIREQNKIQGELALERLNTKTCN